MNETITIKEIMEQTGVKEPSGVRKRIRNGDFDSAGNGTVYYNGKAKKTMFIMKHSRNKNAGRKKKK